MPLARPLTEAEYQKARAAFSADPRDPNEVRAWQAILGVPVDGLVGPAVWAALDDARPDPPPPRPVVGEGSL